jgi:hypothetical protein
MATVPDVESATPNMDVLRQGAAAGQAGPTRRFRAAMATRDRSPANVEARATQQLEAFELYPARQAYLDEYGADLSSAYETLREQGSDVDGTLAGILANLQSDIASIPPGTTGPFRDKLVSMYQEYVTKRRLQTMSEQDDRAELERDIALSEDPTRSPDSALERLRIEGQEAVPPPSAQQGRGELQPSLVAKAAQNLRENPLAAEMYGQRLLSASQTADSTAMARLNHEVYAQQARDGVRGIRRRQRPNGKVDWSKRKLARGSKA